MHSLGGFILAVTIAVYHVAAVEIRYGLRQRLAPLSKGDRGRKRRIMDEAFLSEEVLELEQSCGKGGKAGKSGGKGGGTASYTGKAGKAGQRQRRQTCECGKGYGPCDDDLYAEPVFPNTGEDVDDGPPLGGDDDEPPTEPPVDTTGDDGDGELPTQEPLEFDDDEEPPSNDHDAPTEDDDDEEPPSNDLLQTDRNDGGGEEVDVDDDNVPSNDDPEEDVSG